jgi:hypothetical protein
MRILLILSLMCGSFSYGQFNYFVYNSRNILSATDSSFTVSVTKPGEGKLNTYTDSVTTLKHLLDYSIAEIAHSDTLECSSTLTQLCLLTARRYTGLGHAKKTRWQTVRRQLLRSFVGSKCRFGMISAYAFNIPLVKTTGEFYYDKEGPDGAYNLYDGKQKPRATEEDPEPEAHALEYYTEAELQKMIGQKMRRTRCAKELKRGLCSYYGYSVQIDRKSLYSSNKVPQAQVIIIIGSKRLKLVKPKDF